MCLGYSVESSINYAGGNPWVLLTSALAELLYRGASEIIASEGRVLTGESLAAWGPALGIDLAQMNATAAEGLGHAAVAAAMAGAGDGVLVRLHRHVQPNGFHLSEQIDRNTGVSMAAKDLTWSYANTLKAMHARSGYFDAVAARAEATTATA